MLVPADEFVTAIACGAYHTALCCQSGRVYVCGSNGHGQLGLGHCNDTDTPQLVTALDPYAHSDDGEDARFDDREKSKRGRAHETGASIVLTLDGALGSVDSTRRAAGAAGGGGGRGVVNAACGGYHTLFVCRDGSVWCCGSNERGQLGVRQARQVGGGGG